MMNRYYYNPPLEFGASNGPKFKLKELRKSDHKTSKYEALIEDEDGKQKWVYFGHKAYEHYRDSTPIKAYWDLDHLDKERKKKYHKRFRNKNGYASQLSKVFLWT